MTPSSAPKWLLPAVALAMALALVSVFQRHRVEQGNKAVGMAVEYETVEALAAAERKGVPEALANLKAQGLTHVVLSEETTGELIAEGRLSPTALTLLAERQPTEAIAGELQTPAFQRFLRGLQVRFGDQLPNEPSPGLLRTVALGLDPDAVRRISDAGLGLIGRYGNPAGIDSRGVKETLRWAKEQGVAVFMPQGDAVLGRRDSVGATVEALEQFDLLYASPEFTRITGDATIVDRAQTRVIRLHSAQAQELDRLPYADAVDRYARAARERNMRLLLVRPVSLSGAAPATEFAAFVKDINDSIRREGGQIGPPRPFEEPGVPRVLFLAIGLAAALVAGGVVASVFPAGPVRTLGLLGCGLLAAMCWSPSLRDLAAFAFALVFPVAGFFAVEREDRWPPVLGFLVVTLTALAGGLVVAGLLNGLPYLVKAEQFPGVKVAVFLPIVLIGGWFLARLYDWNAALKSPVTWGAGLLAIVVVGVLAFMVSRTGNEGPAGVSGTELAFRNLLDRVLYVRPRTKEFLIGHPLLIVGLGMLGHLRRHGLQGSLFGLWTALALAGGAVGTTSVLNTLCHLHTPVALSLARVGIGAALGCILGFLLWKVVERRLPVASVGG